MKQAITTLLEQRTSADQYDATKSLSIAEIEELTRLATLAPTAFNFQNWKFIAVHSPEAKQRLKAVAYGQEKIANAAVTFIICGKLEAHKGLAKAIEPAVKAGIVPEEMAKSWVAMATGAHEGNPTRQRDEAIRSASLGAMALMLAAQGMGLVSGPMVGFDPAGVTSEFNLSANDIPVMLVAVGYSAPGNWPQKPRLPVKEILTIV